MSVHIDITPRAERQAYHERDWWRANRSDAPSMFDDELSETFRLLSEFPEAGHLFPRPRFPKLRRRLMRKTRRFIAYEYEPTTNRILVLAIWGTAQERPPKLSRR